VTRHDPALARKLYAPAQSRLEATLSLHLRSAGLNPETEFRFHPPRRWRFDFAFVDQKVAVECEGGTYSGGRHTRGKGFALDCEKYNQASLDGWTLLRFTSAMIQSGEALAQIEQALNETSQTEIRD